MVHNWRAHRLAAASGFDPLSFDKPFFLVPESGLKTSFWSLWLEGFPDWIPRTGF